MQIENVYPEVQAAASTRASSGPLLKSMGAMEEDAGVKSCEILAAVLRSLPGAICVL